MDGIVAYKWRSGIRLLSAARAVIQFKTFSDRDLVSDHVACAGDAEQHIPINAEPLTQCAEWFDNRAAASATPIGLVGERD
jgi:hypothetical protein